MTSQKPHRRPTTRQPLIFSATEYYQLLIPFFSTPNFAAYRTIEMVLYSIDTYTLPCFAEMYHI